MIVNGVEFFGSSETIGSERGLVGELKFSGILVKPFASNGMKNEPRT